MTDTDISADNIGENCRYYRPIGSATSPILSAVRNDPFSRKKWPLCKSVKPNFAKCPTFYLIKVANCHLLMQERQISKLFQNYNKNGDTILTPFFA